MKYEEQRKKNKQSVFARVCGVLCICDHDGVGC